MKRGLRKGFTRRSHSILWCTVEEGARRVAVGMASCDFSTIVRKRPSVPQELPRGSHIRDTFSLPVLLSLSLSLSLSFSFASIIAACVIQWRSRVRRSFRIVRSLLSTYFIVPRPRRYVHVRRFRLLLPHVVTFCAKNPPRATTPVLRFAQIFFFFRFFAFVPLPVSPVSPLYSLISFIWLYFSGIRCFFELSAWLCALYGHLFVLSSIVVLRGIN